MGTNNDGLRFNMKAGKEHFRDIDRQRWIKEGMKTVVEWVRWHNGLMEFMCMHHEEEWQAKLKEWGIDNG